MRSKSVSLAFSGLMAATYLVFSDRVDSALEPEDKTSTAHTPSAILEQVSIAPRLRPLPERPIITATKQETKDQLATNEKAAFRKAKSASLQHRFSNDQKTASLEVNFIKPDIKPTFVEKDDPKKERWLNRSLLNHQRFQIEKLSAGCTFPCDQKLHSQDAKIAGVVIKTERLTNSDSSILLGQIKQGHYILNTPAIYIE